MYLRQNIVQAVIGEILGVSQPTVSRAIIISPPGNDSGHTQNNLPETKIPAPGSAGRLKTKGRTNAVS